VRIWTAHLRPDRPPLLVREGFSLGAFLFGPLWLAFHRAWIPAVLALLASGVIVRMSAPPVSTVLLLGEMVLLGLSGRDLVRWALARRGYVLAHAVVARDADGALVQQPDQRAELTERYAR
jgi:hypothetical protein